MIISSRIYEVSEIFEEINEVIHIRTSVAIFEGIFLKISKEISKRIYEKTIRGFQDESSEKFLEQIFDLNLMLVIWTEIHSVARLGGILAAIILTNPAKQIIGNCGNNLKNP